MAEPMTDNHNRRTFLKIAGGTGALGLTGLAGCAGNSSNGGGGSSEGGDTITLGGSMSLTGDNADLGRLYKDAYQETIDRINENGGVEAGDGNTYELEMELRDDGTDASTSRSLYPELIDRAGIAYLLGAESRSVAPAARGGGSEKAKE